MHESHMAEELVEQAGRQAVKNGLAQIARIHVCLGKECHITEEALNSWFELAKEGTIAGQAVLEIETGEGDSLLLVSLDGKEEEP